MPADPVSRARKLLAEAFDLRLLELCDAAGRQYGQMVGYGSDHAREAADVYNALADMQVPT